MLFRSLVVVYSEKAEKSRKNVHVSAGYGFCFGDSGAGNVYDKRNIENVKDIVVPAESVLKPRRVVRVGVGESIMVAVYYDYGVFIQSAFFKPLDKLSDSAVGVVYRLNIASEDAGLRFTISIAIRLSASFKFVSIYWLPFGSPT